MKNKNELPSTLWENVLLAVHDLELVEKSEQYTVNMDSWHTPEDNSENCSVCFAGSNMAMTKKLSPHKYVDNLYHKFTQREHRLFGSLDYIRLYEINKALNNFLGLNTPTQALESAEENKETVYALMEFENITTPLLGIARSPNANYENNPEEFKSNMRKIAGHLKTLGI